MPTDTIELARELIGTILVHATPDGIVAGRIVETEAYPPGDAASHAFRGPTPRSRSMFLGRGCAYIYLSCGLHHVVNVTSETAGVGAAVLLRALEPVAGIEIMQAWRGQAPLQDLCRGPGRLAVALGVDLSCDGTDLCGPGSLWLATRVGRSPGIKSTARIGITKNADRRLRFFERGCPFVSGPKRGNT